jgi:hypothetical protein
LEESALFAGKNKEERPAQPNGSSTRYVTAGSLVTLARGEFIEPRGPLQGGSEPCRNDENILYCNVLRR